MAALGAYSGAAALYALDSSELLFLLQGHRGGITQVALACPYAATLMRHAVLVTMSGLCAQQCFNACPASWRMYP